MKPGNNKRLGDVVSVIALCPSVSVYNARAKECRK